VGSVDSFRKLGLSDDRLAAIEAHGWEEPTYIQLEAIPPALDGRDIVGIAQTGTGKTGGFMLPILESLRPKGGLQALVLCPTRELAQQVRDETMILAKGSIFRAEVVVGGVSYGPQNDAFRDGVEIIVATPGRLIDHMDRGNVDFSAVRFLVLDEADRMLDMGFRPQIEQLLRKVPRERQTMLFSATIPNGVHALALQLSKDPVWVEAAPSGTTAEGITELVYSVKPEKKPDLLLELLQEQEWDQVLIFTRTKIGADTLRTMLEKAGIKAEALHSDRMMKHRTRALERFVTGKVRVLVATDIAQRGLDVEGISHVVNYDVPQDPDDYVHRIGRTARAGAHGTAVTFVTASDLGAMSTLEHRLGRPLDRIHLPEFDYAGTPRTESRSAAQRGAHSRTPHGMGSRTEDELSDEDLEKLLKYGKLD
jgi:ATP-dependent RNA helicase RhlE